MNINDARNIVGYVPYDVERELARRAAIERDRERSLGSGWLTARAAEWSCTNCRTVQPAGTVCCETCYPLPQITRQELEASWERADDEWERYQDRERCGSSWLPLEDAL